MPASKSRRSQDRVSRGEKLRACTETERRLLSLIRAVGPVSRAELARKTGLAPLSVTRLIADLLDRDLVTEGARVVAGRGQPSLPLSLARDAAFSYGVSITEDALSIALIDLSGVVRDAWREPFETFDKSAALTRLEKIDLRPSGHAGRHRSLPIAGRGRRCVRFLHGSAPPAQYAAIHGAMGAQ